MINTIEAFNLFCEKYAEKNKNQKLEPGDKAVGNFEKLRNDS